jgi:cell division protein FtsI (penicillin-binding protein 3)
MTGIGLPGEASGLVTARKQWSKYTQTSVAFGHEVAVTPVQMARAFAVFSRPAGLAGTLPMIRLTALDPDDPDRGIVYRVMPAWVAALTRDTLRQVALNMEQKMKAAFPEEGPWRYAIFGKSGTAEIPLGKPPPGMRRPRGASGYFDDQYNSSFVAGGPAESPRLVVLCVIDDPGPRRVGSKTHYGTHVAGPVVRRVMERGLMYLGVTPSPVPTAPVNAHAGHETAD